MTFQIEEKKEENNRIATPIEIVKLEYFTRGFEISWSKPMEEIIEVSFSLRRKCCKCGSEIGFKKSYRRRHPKYSPSTLRGFANRWLQPDAYILCDDCGTKKKASSKRKRQPRKEIRVEDLEQL